MTYKFTQDWFQRAPPLLEQIRPILPTRQAILEVGSFEGRSTVWLLEHMLDPNGYIIAIDTWEGGEEHRAAALDMGSVEERFDHNIGVARGKFPDRYVEKHKGTSFEHLAGLAVGRPDDAPLDLIYIDGSHIAKDVLTDAVMSWPMLKKGGVMVFDDYLWGDPRDILHRPKLGVDSFVNAFTEELEVIHAGYQLAVWKR